jgi:molybdopterin-guanine dinucleotide biosynthesis protein A
MRAFVDAVDTQRLVMPEQASLTNVNTLAELEATAPRIA